MAKNFAEDYPLEELSGLEKAAILLLALDEETGSTIMSNLDETTVEELTRELAGLGSVPHHLSDAIVEEYYNLALAQTWINDGGLDYASRLLRRSIDPSQAEHIIQQVSQQVQQTPLPFCRKPKVKTCSRSSRMNTPRPSR